MYIDNIFAMVQHTAQFSEFYVPKPFEGLIAYKIRMGRKQIYLCTIQGVTSIRLINFKQMQLFNVILSAVFSTYEIVSRADRAIGRKVEQIIMIVVGGHNHKTVE